MIASEDRHISDEQAFRKAKHKAEQALQETNLAAEKASQETKLAVEKASQNTKLAAERVAAASEEAVCQTKLYAEKALQETRLAAEKARQDTRLGAEKAAMDDEQAARKVRLLHSIGLPPEDHQRQMMSEIPAKRRTPRDDALSQLKKGCTSDARSVDKQLAALAVQPYYGKYSLSQTVWERLVSGEVPNLYTSMVDAFKVLHRV